MQCWEVQSKQTIQSKCEWAILYIKQSIGEETGFRAQEEWF